MIVTLGNLYYYPLKLYVYIASYLYFRKLRVVGKKNIPAKGPIIFAINHQNALLDALLLSVVAWRSPHFLTRADVFNKGFVIKFLRGLKMLPIYRIRDGYDSIKKNEETFNAANEILQNGGVVGIFPEGSHSLKYQVRPLKKGVARIAFMAEESANFNLNTQIIPIGIQYENHFLPEGRTLITFGKPIKVKDFNEAYRADKNKGIDLLIAEIHKGLKSLVLNIEGPDYEKTLAEFKALRVFKSNLTEQLKSDQNLVNAIESGEPFTEVSSKSNILFRSLRYLWDIAWKILAFIPRKFMDMLVKKTVRDPHFNATMRFGYSIFAYPIFFLLIYFLIASLVS
jgi:1-acyl-sn-glycerol-3-phosphate acyltransferase